MKSLSTRRPLAPRFRHRLAEELAKRCASNARYSLRAFAKMLEIDHSSLSQILRGRRALTEATIRKLGTKLRLTEREIEAYASRERAAATGGAEREVERLTTDTVELLADWHHFAILELSRIEGFEADSRWIARALDLDVDEVNVAVQRLLRLRLLRMDGDRWVDTSGDVLGEIDDFHRAAIQRLAAQLRELSAAAVERIPHERRQYSVTTLGVSTNRIPDAFAILERARNEIAALFDDENMDDVYRLEISFVPATRLGEEREND